MPTDYNPQVRALAIWRRPKLTARGDPDHDHVVTGIVARLLELPRRAVVLAEDETHLNLLPHVRTSLDARRCSAGGSHPWQEPAGHRVRALEVSTGAWVYWLGRCVNLTSTISPAASGKLSCANESELLPASLSHMRVPAI